MKRSEGNVTMDSVEKEPSFAAELFGEQIDKARRFTEDLAGRGEELGLIGPLELSRLWTRHIVNCVLLAPLLNPGNVGDIGSGAGLPGLVLAIARPDVNLFLIEPMERRVEWLNEQVELLELENVTVLRDRAEEVRVPKFDQVTARAVMSLRKLIPVAVRLVRPGGQLLLQKGRRVQEEIQEASREIAKAHLSDLEVLELGQGLTSETTMVFKATVG